MSEGTDSSAKDGGTEVKSSSQSSKTKRNPWKMIAAIIVAALLVLVVLYVVMQPKGHALTVAITSPAKVDAGKTVLLHVDMTMNKNSSKEKVLTENEVKILWSKTPSNLGDFDVLFKSTVNFTAAKSAMTGTITCKVTYKDSSGKETTESDTVDIEINPPFFARVSVLPSSAEIGTIGGSVNFTATAYDSVDAPISGVTFTWAVTGMPSSDYTLNSTSGKTVKFTGLAIGNASLNVTGTLGSTHIYGTAMANVTGLNYTRTVDYRWYDMFNVPFGEWWDARWDVYRIEEPLSHSYPYIFREYMPPAGNNEYMSNLRLDITGRNMTELNMTSHPEFLPYLGTAGGGNAIIIWYLQYLTAAELQRYPNATPAWNDGWAASLNGTVILDQSAAESVLGIDPFSWNDFATWWTDNNASVTTQYIQWLQNESGPNRLDIYPMYDGVLQILYFSLSAERLGDYVFLTYDTVSWGMEALMARWLHEAFLPTEWWLEDMFMIASIGPERADLDISTAVAYALEASEPVDKVGEPCWIWKGTMGDFIESSPPSHPHSDFDPYAPNSYLELSPGNAYYRTMKSYDYTPGAFNLTVNETMTFEWPSGPQLFKVQDALNPTEALNYTDEMIVDYSEPMHTDNADYAPGAVYRDNITKQLTFIGPIDMWNWSKEQTAHQYLADEWARLGMLPYGMPYIEFKPAAYVSTWPDFMVLSNVPSRPVIDTPLNLTLVVADNLGITYWNCLLTTHSFQRTWDCTTSPTASTSTDWGTSRSLARMWPIPPSMARASSRSSLRRLALTNSGSW